jgi:hypothetical protein
MKGRPFQAEFEETHTKPSTGEVIRRWGSIARDSEGRRRQENFLIDPEQPSTTRRAIMIWDQVTLTFYGIDPERKEAKKLEMGPILQAARAAATMATPGAASEPPMPAQPPSPSKREVIPGEKAIEGVLCHGLLYTLESGEKTIEHWFSGQIDEVVLEITKEKDLEIVYRLFNIRLTEPDPALFRLPEDVVVIEADLKP